MYPTDRLEHKRWMRRRLFISVVLKQTFAVSSKCSPGNKLRTSHIPSDGMMQLEGGLVALCDLSRKIHRVLGYGKKV